MKKAVKVTLGVVGGIIVIAAIASSAGKSNTQTVPNSNSNATQQSAEQKPAATEKMTIKNSAYQEANGLKEVVGEVTNNDTTKHTANIKATFYSADGKILGTAIGTVLDVAPGETKTFNLYTNDSVTGYKDMKVQVDALI